MTWDSSFGPGWPQGCPNAVPLIVDGAGFPGGIHRELHDLAEMLLEASVASGYKLHPGWCWGYANRPIKGVTPPQGSNHSSGTALDLNAPANPMGTTTTDMPRSMVELWESYGWTWGGRWVTSRPDPMHYEFRGSVAEARKQTARARTQLGSEDEMTPEQIDKLKESAARWEGAFAYIAASDTDLRADPPEGKPKAFREGWRFARALSIRGQQ